ncbi:hypothetical protein PIB30_031078 [Stylosanthes scabra]|uniref:Non-specific lipid-transfer protein n=1 Tax=Stylosanthes scabra TaxID=79078 RepID=A0ABU6TBG0_9FABA|nr:hypothetical protein [Stylosanthes scabra]
MVACMSMMIVGLISFTQAEAGPSCGDVQDDLSPCIPYVTGNDNNVPGACCSGIKKVNSQAKTTQDRRSVCVCIKTTAHSVRHLNINKLSKLPAFCGVNLPYKLSPSIDCNRIN